MLSLSRRSCFSALGTVIPTFLWASDTQPIDKTKLRAYESALEILNDLPEKLKPKTKVGWDKYRFDDVKPWLTTEPVGRLFESRFKIRRAYVDKARSFVGTSGGQKWMLKYDFVDRKFQFRGLDVKEGIYFANVKQPLLIGDEAFARRAEKIPAGHNVAVRGTIKSIYFSRYAQSASLGITLEEVEVSSSLFDTL